MLERRDQNAAGGVWRKTWRFAASMAVVIGGVVIAQLLLYGPSLMGSKILLPLDFLAGPGVYLPSSAESAKIVPHDFVLSDLVLQDEPNRQFAASEIRAGRWPLWTPYQFGGSPFASYPKYSPLKILASCVASPIILAWSQVLLAVFVGLGAYVFCRSVLRVGYWPAVLAAWCWPLTGFFVFWQGYNLPLAAAWLPWMLLAVDKAARQASRWAGLGLAVATCLTLISGQLDIGAQVLLASGFYAVWCFIDEYGKECFARRVLSPLIVVVVGWMVGFLLASPYLLPILEYARTGARMARRSQGEQERPTVGLDALPQTVLPDMYGSTQDGSFPMFPKGEGNLPESSSVTYTGLLATLFLAPLAWCSRRHRSINAFWIVLGFLGLSWCLDVPVIVDVMKKLPGLNMLSHNRFVFVTSFAILAMATTGLEVLRQGDVRWRLWFWLPVALLAILLLWCDYRTMVLPRELAAEVHAVQKGSPVPGIADPAAATRIQATYVHCYGVAALLCALGMAGWLLVGLRANWRPWLLPALGALLVADLLWFAYGRSAQCDPALYYPRIPVLRQLARATPGRIMGYGCLPAILAQTHGLRDVRGYDGVDPARLIDLMAIAADPRTRVMPYALTQWLGPLIPLTSSGYPQLSPLRLSPVLDMLNVRYVIFRGSPPDGLRPDFSSPDYWVLMNGNALPRAFVPSHVEAIVDDQTRLARLAAADFNPRQTAFVEQPVQLPAECRGSAEIVGEIPTRVTISCNMETAGLVVLADLWDSGWSAYWEGKPVPILRTNHAIRGVVVPAGKGTLEFRYEPASLAWGWRLCGLAVVILLGWAWRGRRSRLPDRNPR